MTKWSQQSLLLTNAKNIVNFNFNYIKIIISENIYIYIHTLFFRILHATWLEKWRFLPCISCSTFLFFNNFMFNLLVLTMRHHIFILNLLVVLGKYHFFFVMNLHMVLKRYYFFFVMNIFMVLKRWRLANIRRLVYQVSSISFPYIFTSK